MRCLTLLVSVFCLCLSTLSFAQVGSLFADLGLNKDIFYPPDTMQVWVHGSNNGPDVVVDVYLSVKTPDGKELFAPDFTEMAHSWISNLALPQGFSLGWKPISEYRLPSIELPLATPGKHIASLWLCAAGTDQRVTPGSSEKFTLAPCKRKTWVNDNNVLSLQLVFDYLLCGLTFNGVGAINVSDPSSRTLWTHDDGIRQSRCQLVPTLGGGTAVCGQTGGIVLMEPYGWRRIMDEPGTPFYTYGIARAACDNQGSIWVCDEWDYFLYSQAPNVAKRLLRFFPSGEVSDETSAIGEDVILGLCAAGDRQACVVTRKGVYLYNGASFDYLEVPYLATDSSISMQCVNGDAHGNVWFSCFAFDPSYTRMGYNLVKFSIENGGCEVFDKDTPGLPSPMVVDVKNDPQGNVWFACANGFAKYDGTTFIAFPAGFLPTMFEVGPDGTIYSGSYGSGVQALRGGIWQSFNNPNPEMRSAYYYACVGTDGGGGMLAYNSTNAMQTGIEVLNADKWTPMYEESLPWVHGVSEGQAGLWAWGADRVYGQEGADFVDSCPGCDLASFGRFIGVLEDDEGTPFLLTHQALLTYQDGTWSTLDTPNPQGLAGYNGMTIDHLGRVILSDWQSGIEVRGPDGIWSRIDASNLLPAAPEGMGVSERGLIYVCGSDAQKGYYLLAIEGDAVDGPYWLDEKGWPTLKSGCITFDLADRAWLMTLGKDRAPRWITCDPDTKELSEIPRASGLMPCFWDLRNTSIANSGFDRSFGRTGVLWTLGDGVARLNLAPRTELLLDKAAYSHGEAMRVDAYFANQAGSIPIDWYAAAEDEHGNLFYWPTYTQAKTPAFQGLFVPTDTALILQLDNIVIPGDVPPGHYKWKTGFTRAGETTWLGLGFTATGEFDITAKP